MVSKVKLKQYKSLGEIVLDVAEILQPPERLTVSQSAAKYRVVNNPGSYVGPWLNETTPYLVEVMDELNNREFGAVVFAKPAQCGGTDAGVNWVLHSVVCDPGDMMVVQTSQPMARDFSRRRIDRLHRHSPEVGSRMIGTGDADNTFDKYYRSGMILNLSWPSINELSGRPIRRVWLTDIDRMPENIDGEGSPFDLGRKRTTSFGSAGKTYAESSPGYIIEDPKWIRRTPHEAPPCKGILSLFNRGDRRLWHWQCEHCGQWFEPTFDLLKYPDTKDKIEAGEAAAIMCPHCAALMQSDRKYELNLGGRWVKEGQVLTREGKLEGSPRRSDIASFWLKGPAATFASWKALVVNYLMAMEEFELTGSQEALKSTVNTDQGEAYYLRGTDSERRPEQLKEKSEQWEEGVVPHGVRTLIATADVQKNMWVVQVYGIAPGAPFDLVVIDRFKIIKSHRLDDDGERLWVKPASHPEDWWLLQEEVMRKRYPLADGRGTMGVMLTCCDSGGREGVTTRAYDFWRALRDKGEGEHKRFQLVKGDPSPGAPRVRISYPDAQRKDKMVAARGDVPVLMINSNLVKDSLSNRLEAEPGGGALRFPDHLEDAFFVEMCNERRTAKGWDNPSKKRNEAWDLSYYALAACLHLKVDRINWDAPPPWADEWPKNFHVQTKESAKAADPAPRKTLADLAAQLA